MNCVVRMFTRAWKRSGLLDDLKKFEIDSVLCFRFSLLPLKGFGRFRADLDVLKTRVNRSIETIFNEFSLVKRETVSRSRYTRERYRFNDLDRSRYT